MTKALSQRVTAILVLVLIGLALFSASFINHARSTASSWAWSSTTGWINLSSTGHNDGIILGSGDPVNGYPITGYAWSSNLGWIQFGGGLSGFPTGTNGEQSVNAKIVPNSSGNGATVTGWAKALAADNVYWDGWIYLGSTGHNDGVIANNTGALSGYAWGGPVLGWVSFSTAYGGGNITPPCTSGYSCPDSNTSRSTNPWCVVVNTPCTYGCSGSSGQCNPAPSGTLSLSGTSGTLKSISVRKGQTTTVYWNMSNVTSCSLRGTNGDSWSGLALPSGHVTTSAIQQKTVYTLSCYALNGTTLYTDTTIVNLIPAIQEI